jgi:hypothetical protein
VRPTSKGDTMFRTFVAGAAIAGALTLGAAGIAGASTRAAGTTGADKAALCAKLPALQAKVQKVEAKVSTWVPKAQAAYSASGTTTTTS